MPTLSSFVLIDAAVPSVVAALREQRVPRLGWLGHLVHTSELDATETGTRLTETVRWSAPPGLGPQARLLRAPLRTVLHPVLHPAWRAVLRPVLRVALRRRGARIRTRAQQLHAAPTVVAAALVHEGRVLAQQRARPAALAGRWELPGGRVEPGETAHEALIRECLEELAARVVPGARLGPDVPLPGGLVLRVHLAVPADPRARPEAVEHAALRWVNAAELPELDWLDADRAVLADLAAVLADGAVPADRAVQGDPTAEPADPRTGQDGRHAQPADTGRYPED